MYYILGFLFPNFLHTSHLWLPQLDLVAAQHLLSLAQHWDVPGGGITIVIPIRLGGT